MKSEREWNIYKAVHEKPYSIEMEDRGEYLYAIVGGLKVEPEMAKEYWAEIIEMCDELGVSKLLVEKNFVETMSMDSLVKLSGHMNEILRGRKLAFVDRYGHDEISELGKTLARAQNVQIRIFHNAADAEKWLLAGPPASPKPS